MKHFLNRVKARKWYRPVAPIVLAHRTVELFGHLVKSPYMSFAPHFLPEFHQEFPAVVHLDGTGRVQTVTKSLYPWLYRLLTKIEEATGHIAVIANTSFNTKGEPIVNTARRALEIFRNTKLIFAAYIEDFRVARRTSISRVRNSCKLLPTVCASRVLPVGQGCIGGQSG